MFEFDLSVDRIRAARSAIDASGTGILLTARSEGFLVGRADLGATIRRSAWPTADAGADCLYAAGSAHGGHGGRVNAVSPEPVNVLVRRRLYQDAGARRDRSAAHQRGRPLARAAWTGFLRAATEIAEHGSFSNLSDAMSFAELNALFERAASMRR